jgi:hypothetical protein
MLHGELFVNRNALTLRKINFNLWKEQNVSPSWRMITAKEI